MSCSAWRTALSLDNPVPGPAPELKRKENSSSDACRRLRDRLRCRSRSTKLGRWRDLNRLPFRQWARPFSRRPYFSAFRPSLRTDSPATNCCSRGTLPHFGLQSSHLNICYYHQDLHWPPFQPGSRPGLRHYDGHALLRTAGVAHLPQWLSIGLTVSRCSAINFQS